MWSCISNFCSIMFIRFHRLNNNIKLGLIVFIIYVFNRFILKSLDLPYISYFLKNHFNDFLGGILFCCYVNALLFYNKKKLITNFFLLFSFMLIVSIIWEYIFPLFLKYSTSDMLDIIAYMCGTFLYYLLLNKYNKKLNYIVI